MKKNCKAFTGIVCMVFLGLGVISLAVAADEVRISGTINDDGQLVDESGQVYEIADEGVGAEVMEYSGEKLSITGMVEEEEGTRFIVIKSYKPLVGESD
jgi:hypothetical protein